VVTVMSKPESQTADRSALTLSLCAGRVRSAQKELNDAVDAAAEAGIAVNFGISIGTHQGVNSTRVSMLRIERPRNWRTGDEGKQL